MDDGPKQSEETRQANRLTLEICFLAVVGVVVVAAFFEALTYQLVSSRTPFVIIAPLFVLIVIQAWRLSRQRDRSEFRERMRLALSGGVRDLNRVVAMSLWMCVLLALVVVFGHYAGILAFGFILMRILADETLLMSVVVAAATTAIIYAVFEIGFDVELYRGLVMRYFQGYRDF